MQKIKEILPASYPQQKVIFDSICDQALDQDKSVRRHQLELLATRLLQLSEGSTETKLFAADLITLLCTEIRAMDK